MVQKFRKKPVVIEAIQWNGFSHEPDIPEIIKCPNYAIAPDSAGWIPTLEGGHIVSVGDWIITGVKGEKYPCKPDIFEMTHSSRLKSVVSQGVKP